MKTINIARFKGFKSNFNLSLNQKSLLAYGENGAGKSSFYEALNIYFFRNKIENSLVSIGKTPEERTQAINDYLSARQNLQEKKEFEIRVNELLYFDKADRDKYAVYMISGKELHFDLDEIVLGNFIHRLYFDRIEDDFLEKNYKTIQDRVNYFLKNSFSENIEIVIDSADNFRCIVKDTMRNLEDSGSLSLKFNESRLHLVRLLLLFQIVIIASEGADNKILVLDDIIVSLDASNRAYILKYIIESFGIAFQILILTHSAGFYNLCKFQIETLKQRKICSEWQYFCFYSNNGDCKFYIEKNNFRTNIDDLKKRINESDGDFELLGNELRQIFEVLIHKLARKLQADGIQESSSLINRIHQSGNVYLKDSKTASDLVDEIKKLIDLPINKDLDLVTTINKKIKEYCLEDLNIIRDLISDIQLFQKVALHPLSHGHLGVSPVTKKELTGAVLLLEQFNRMINTITVHNESYL